MMHIMVAVSKPCVECLFTTKCIVNGLKDNILSVNLEFYFKKK